MKKFAIMTMKGGTGKTTTAVNIAHGLALSGKSVLLIDCDPQRNAALTFGVQGEKGLAQLLTSGDVDILEVREKLFLIDSGGRNLAEVELILGRKESREKRLTESLKYLRGCNYVICDCPPSINLININALAFCDEVIIPVSMDYLSQHGASQTMDIMEDTLVLAEGREIGYRILPTFYDARTNLSKTVLEQVSERFSEKIFRTVIRINTSLREAPGECKTIYEHAPLSRGAYDYYKLTEEILDLYGNG